MREAKRVTEALVKFLHDYQCVCPKELIEIREALSVNDLRMVRKLFPMVRIEGNGSITDSWPCVLHKNEDQEFLYQLLVAMTMRWSAVVAAECIN